MTKPIILDIKKSAPIVIKPSRKTATMTTTVDPFSSS